ncbi:DUF3795 domain-containing protein [Oscillospiraceae bacterium CM]|nr:DUF3795 domain-containing protein [Oscillospiraceae bacterium CM]
MKAYKRDYPLFSLCGLNCGLCPRYQSKSASRCPGCGGQDFHLKHPSCAVIACSQKHDNVAYCFQCAAYPCERYQKQSDKDSFITYRHVISDLEKARVKGIEAYMKELNEKVAFLEQLVNAYNDGRRMNTYCVAVNLLDLEDLNDIKNSIRNKVNDTEMALREKIAIVISEIEEKARKNNIDLRLRK